MLKEEIEPEVTQHICPKCGKDFQYASKLKRHENSVRECTGTEKKHTLGGGTYSCNGCGKDFVRPENVVKHCENACREWIDLKSRGKTADNCIIVDTKPQRLPLDFSYVDYDEEDMSLVSNHDLKKIIRSERNILEAYLINIHLNPDKPQQQTIIFSHGDGCALAFMGSGWHLCPTGSFMCVFIRNTFFKLKALMKTIDDRTIKADLIDAFRAKIAEIKDNRNNIRKKIIPILKKTLNESKDMVILTKNLNEMNLLYRKLKNIPILIKPDVKDLSYNVCVKAIKWCEEYH